MWFDENLEYLHEIANKKGFAIVEESYINGGKKYMLVTNNIGQELNPEIKDINNLL
jgi:D-alanine-D-alanine ligase-like ATP-grasp enzyme